MGANSWFLGGTMTMLLFNFFYMSYYPDTANIMFLGAVTGLLTQTMVVGAVAGIQVFGVGLNDSSTKIIFGVSALINMLFQVNVAGVPVGIGLANRVIDAFNASELMGFGFLVATVLCVIVFFSGVIIVLGGID